MIYNKIMKYLTIFFFLSFSNNLLSDDKIYYIDMNILMNNSLAGQSITAKLEKQNETNKKNFKRIEDDLKKEEAKIVSQKNILDETEYKKKIQLFTKKISDYRSSRDKAINDITIMRNKAQKLLISSVTPILAEYAEKNKISYIIPKQSIIIGKTNLNLTKTILEILDSKIKNINVK